MNKQALRSKFLGALTGTGVGDALGAGFEGHHAISPKEIEQKARREETLVYTDDTHMMIGVAESLIHNKGFNGQHMAHTFVNNYEREPFRGYGPGPPQIFAQIRAGVPWNEAARRLFDGGSFGNGSAMRIAPIGVFYHNDPALLRDVAYRSSEITHAHSLGKEGAALQAYAIALATNLDQASDFDQRNFLDKVITFVPQGKYKEKLGMIGSLLDRPDKVAFKLGNGIEAFNSVPTAIFSFLSHPHSFAQAVVYAISLGGDTDTIGAMAGAISGAYLGVDSIPAAWREKLENEHYIEELAIKLWEVVIAL